MRKMRLAAVAVALAVPLSLTVMPATAGAKTCHAKAGKVCPAPRFR
jgi:hypothetical protein